jgi:hypothetical protein
MEPRVLEEITKHYKQEVIEFDWEPVRKQPKRYGILYPIIGYITSLLAVVFLELGAFMWLFLIAGFIFFFGGILCVNGILGDYVKINGAPEDSKNRSEMGSPCDARNVTFPGARKGNKKIL